MIRGTVLMVVALGWAFIALIGAPLTWVYYCEDYGICSGGEPVAAVLIGVGGLVGSVALFLTGGWYLHFGVERAEARRRTVIARRVALCGLAVFVLGAVLAG